MATVVLRQSNCEDIILANQINNTHLLLKGGVPGLPQSSEE